MGLTISETQSLRTPISLFRLPVCGTNEEAEHLGHVALPESQGLLSFNFTCCVNIDTGDLERERRRNFLDSSSGFQKMSTEGAGITSDGGAVGLSPLSPWDIMPIVSITLN